MAVSTPTDTPVAPIAPPTVTTWSCGRDKHGVLCALTTECAAIAANCRAVPGSVFCSAGVAAGGVQTRCLPDLSSCDGDRPELYIPLTKCIETATAEDRDTLAATGARLFEAWKAKAASVPAPAWMCVRITNPKKRGETFTECHRTIEACVQARSVMFGKAELSECEERRTAMCFSTTSGAAAGEVSCHASVADCELFQKVARKRDKTATTTPCKETE